MDLKSHKGHDLHIAGFPSHQLDSVFSTSIIKLHPLDFPGIKPKLLVSEGDTVINGQPVYFDKNNPEVMFTSFSCGTVSKIVYGDRRSILSIDIQLNDRQNKATFKQHEPDKIKNLKKEKIQEILCTSGYWPCIRRRPFAKIAIPSILPKSIFITTESTAPYTPGLKVILDNINIIDVQAGIDALTHLTSAIINMVIPNSENYSTVNDLNGIDIHTFSGPHPAGNVGYHIANIDPIENKETTVWYISLQDIASIGKLLLTGTVDNKKIISIGGSPYKSDNRHLIVNRGISISDILLNDSIGREYRIISGDLLSGIGVEKNHAIGFYHDTVSIIKNEFNREFIGWLNPGFKKYSVSNTFLSRLLPKRKKKLSTAMNGGTRTIMPLGLIEKMCILDILPTMLLKSIIARDIEMMEKMGIYECDPEDFSLCAFVDVSKMDIMSIIQAGLDYVELEG